MNKIIRDIVRKTLKKRNIRGRLQRKTLLHTSFTLQSRVGGYTFVFVRRLFCRKKTSGGHGDTVEKGLGPRPLGPTGPMVQGPWGPFLEEP